MPRRRKLTIADERRFWLLLESGHVLLSTIAAILGRTTEEVTALYAAFKEGGAVTNTKGEQHAKPLRK